MKVIDHKTTSVLLGSKPKQYYFRGDGGTVVDRNFGSKLGPYLMSGEYTEATVAVKADIILLTPNRPGYSAERPMSLGDFYKNEVFREFWFIPINSWCANPKTGELFQGTMTPSVVSTFLIRGQSKDEFANLLQPFEERAFEEWMTGDKKKILKESASMEQFILQRMTQLMNSSVYTFNVEKGNSPQYGDYYYLSWSARPAESTFEKELVEISSIISTEHSNCLVNDVVEKAVLKAASNNFLLTESK